MIVQSDEVWWLYEKKENWMMIKKFIITREVQGETNKKVINGQ